MPYLLEMKNITKTFGSVKAIDNVCLRLNAGEIVSLCGENGSGKSTLMKVLCGIYPHGSYEGEIIFAGEEIQASHIRDTERKGIAIIHQELALVKELTVLENIFLGNEITHNGIMDYDLMTLRCQKLLAQVSLSISPDTRVGDLGLGQQQLVEIAKALNKQVRLLILDEPTASLTEQERRFYWILFAIYNSTVSPVFIFRTNSTKSKRFPIRFALFATDSTLVRVMLPE
ncbi:D-xylose transport ATP-binding protein XylG [Escherichia coli]|uniref:D-xylose transport ATP-binding protein XylG n=1 Tax=Escherichia coli TaxID=562 RepID=A0A377C7C6_ECOLX|nr:D-xylose transport ATP-binding protein XylG [Escherichia coli]